MTSMSIDHGEGEPTGPPTDPGLGDRLDLIAVGRVITKLEGDLFPLYTSRERLLARVANQPLPYRTVARLGAVSEGTVWKAVRRARGRGEDMSGVNPARRARGTDT